MEYRATIKIPEIEVRNMNILLGMYDDDGLKKYGLPMDNTVLQYFTDFENGYKGEVEFYAGYGGFFLYVYLLDEKGESVEDDCFDEFYGDELLRTHTFEDEDGNTYYLTIEEGE